MNKTIVLIFKKKKVSSLVNVGCYSSGDKGFIYSFKESMNENQCSNAAKSGYGFTCGTDGDFFYGLYGQSTMTIEKCVKICVQTNKFIYAGLFE